MIQLLINKILDSERSEAEAAAQEFKRALSAANSKPDLECILRTVLNAPSVYPQIQEEWRQELFVQFVESIYFLGFDREKPGYFLAWLFQLLQHKSEKVRDAAVKMFNLEIITLIPNQDHPKTCPDIDPKRANELIIELLNNLDQLSYDTYIPEYDKWERIEDLPNSVYKSVEIVKAHLNNEMGESFDFSLRDSFALKEIIGNHHELIDSIKKLDLVEQANLITFQAELSQKREEMETKMFPELKFNMPHLDLEHLKAITYECDKFEHEFESLMKRAPTPFDRTALSGFLSFFWNFYPHKELEGYSPYEIYAMLEILRMNSQPLGEDQLFDDCEICQFKKFVLSGKGEHTEQELIEAFKRQNEKNRHNKSI